MRIGQVVGDTKVGIWKDTEAFPLMIGSAVTMSLLLEIDMTCQWLPVDTLAEAVLEIVGLSDVQSKIENGRQLFYNVLSPHTFSWAPKLGSALHATNLSAVEDTSFKYWLAHLRSLSATTASCVNIKRSEAADPHRNPAIKLVDSFAEGFADKMVGSEVVFEISMAEEASAALRNVTKVIESGLLGKWVEVWMKKWASRKDT